MFGSFVDYDSGSLLSFGGLRIKVSLPGRLRFPDILYLQTRSGEKIPFSFLLKYARLVCYSCGSVGFCCNHCSMAIRKDHVLFQFVGPKFGHILFSGSQYVSRRRDIGLICRSSHPTRHSHKAFPSQALPAYSPVQPTPSPVSSTACNDEGSGLHDVSEVLQFPKSTMKKRKFVDTVMSREEKRCKLSLCNGEKDSKDACFKRDCTPFLGKGVHITSEPSFPNVKRKRICCFLGG